ncbi:MAG: DUF6515 family protein [Campylobacterota bacterium]
MYKSKLTTVALATLMFGGVLGAEPWHTGKKENFGEKRSSGFERSSRSERSEQTYKRVVKPSRERAPEVRSKADKTPDKIRRTVKEKTKTQYKQVPQKKAKRVKRPPAWTPPKTKPRPYYHRPGYTIRTIPKVAVSVSLGSLLFYYSHGIYYRHHLNGFIVILPPIGLIVPVLPVGHIPFHVYGRTYYYYADVYYVWDIHHRAYRVVEVPEAGEPYQPGTIVDTLPDGAYTVTIDGVQYYRYGEVYFMQSVQGERIVYIVVIP